MTKLGTPIGAGPKGAIVVVGLAAVGEPPAPNWEPPSPPSARGWSPPPVALGALTPPPEPPPPASPRLSLRVTPLPPASPPSIVAPFLTPLSLRGEGAGAVASGAGTGVAAAAFGVTVASLVPVGTVQSGSARSMRPSASSSRPLAQAGACSEGTAVVVVATEGSVGAPSATGSAPAIPTPRADSARKLASATSSAILALIPIGLGTHSHGSRKLDPLPPHPAGLPTVSVGPEARNGRSRPPTWP